MGHDAGYNLNGGDGNTGYGFKTMHKITSGSYNTAIGPYAGFWLTTAQNNICIGYQSGPDDITAGTDNNQIYIDAKGNYQEQNSIIYGDQSGSNQNLTFNANVKIADDATNSNGNLIVDGDITLSDGGSLKQQNGFEALKIDGSGNITRIGYNNNGSNGQFLKWDGSKAVWATVSGGSGGSSFTSDVEITNADLKLLTSSTNEANWHLATREGHGGSSASPALHSNIQLTTGNYGFIDGGLSSSGTDDNHQTRWNIGLGNEIGNSNSKTTGRFNTFVGNQVAKDTGTSNHYVGESNVVIGHAAFYRGKGSNNSSVNASYNTILGTSAGFGVSGSTTSGYYNTIIGYRAAYKLTSGQNNICLGTNAGHHNTTGNNNIFIGRDTGLNGNDNNKLYIDTRGPTTGYIGTGSLIYGDQDTDITYDTLKLNANVTISNDNSRSQGSLIVEGSATFSNISGMNTTVMQSNTDSSGYILMGARTDGMLRKVMNNSTNSMVTVVEGNDTLKLYSFSQVCFLPGTKITLSDKIKINIENLKKGDTLLSYKLDDMPPYNKSVDVLSWFSEEDKGEFTESEVTNIWSDFLQDI